MFELENLAQVAPKVSLFLMKGKDFETKSDNPRNREESKTKSASKFIPFSIYTSYSMSIPLFRPLQKGEQKQFLFLGFMCHA